MVAVAVVAMAPASNMRSMLPTAYLPRAMACARWSLVVTVVGRTEIVAKAAAA
ncbi:MAG: hypothetical protein J0H97_04215 [Alphaproteobacteria bacterium]|jgi:hypothetical protein|nr:hypothetical protein [Alphaproteobacteria bacterium]